MLVRLSGTGYIPTGSAPVIITNGGADFSTEEQTVLIEGYACPDSDAVLMNGGVPLPILRRQIDEYIAAAGR